MATVNDPLQHPHVSRKPGQRIHRLDLFETVTEKMRGNSGIRLRIQPMPEVKPMLYPQNGSIAIGSRRPGNAPGFAAAVVSEPIVAPM